MTVAGAVSHGFGVCRNRRNAATVTHVMSPARAAVERKSVRSTNNLIGPGPAPEGLRQRPRTLLTSAQYRSVHRDLQAVPPFGARNETDLICAKFSEAHGLRSLRRCRAQRLSLGARGEEHIHEGDQPQE